MNSISSPQAIELQTQISSLLNNGANKHSIGNLIGGKVTFESELRWRRNSRIENRQARKEFCQLIAKSIDSIKLCKRDIQSLQKYSVKLCIQEKSPAGAVRHDRVYYLLGILDHKLPMGAAKKLLQIYQKNQLEDVSCCGVAAGLESLLKLTATEAELFHAVNGIKIEEIEASSSTLNTFQFGCLLRNWFRKHFVISCRSSRSED